MWIDPSNTFHESRGAGDYLSLLQELWVNAHCETAVIFLELEHGKIWKHLEFGGNTGELSWKKYDNIRKDFFLNTFID